MRWPYDETLPKLTAVQFENLLKQNRPPVLSPEEIAVGTNAPDYNEIPDFLRRQPPAAQEAIAQSTGRPTTAYEAQEEPAPHSLSAAVSGMEEANGQKPPPPGAEKAIDAGNPNKVPFRARRAVETWINNTWAGKMLSPTTMDETGEAAKTDIRAARGAIRRTQDAFDAALGKAYGRSHRCI